MNIFLRSRQIKCDILMFLLLFLSLNSGNAEDVCKLITSPGQDIMAIGELPTSILIITKQYEVMNIAKSSLNLTSQQFNLKGSKHMPIEEAYPLFKTDKHFHDVKNKVFSGRIQTINGTTMIDLDTIRDIHHDVGVRYDATKSEFLKGLFYTDTTDQYFLLPTYEQPNYYGFTKPNDSSEYKISYWYQHSFVWIVKHCETVLCQFKDKKDYYIKDGDKACEADVNWQNRRGFVSQGFVYMFSETDVIIFKYDYIKQLSKNDTKSTGAMKSITKSYDEFFDCSGSVDVENISFKNTGPIASALLLALLVAILFCCLCLGTFAYARKKKMLTRSSLVPMFSNLSRINDSRRKITSSACGKPARSKLNESVQIGKLSRSSDKVVKKTTRSSERIFKKLSGSIDKINKKSTKSLPIRASSNARSIGTIRSKLKSIKS